MQNTSICNNAYEIHIFIYMRIFASMFIKDEPMFFSFLFLYIINLLVLTL